MAVGDKTWEVVVIGAGPAGLFAATVAARRKKSVLIIGKEKHSTRLSEAEKIENFPGIGLISGKELSERLWEQAAGEKVEFFAGEVQAIGGGAQGYQLYTWDQTITAKTLILATGVKLRGELPGEKELVSQGVSYCVNCDINFFKGKKVALIAYTHEGDEEVNLLAKVCSKVYYLPLYKGEAGEIDSRVVLVKDKPLRILGDTNVKGLETSKDTLEVDGVFITRESLPADQLLPELALEEGVIKVDRAQATNLSGVFAAGDCTGKPWQIAKSIGEAQVAALSAAKYLDEKRGDK